MEHQSERLRLELEALRERISDKIRYIVLSHQKYTYTQKYGIKKGVRYNNVYLRIKIFAGI